MEFDWGFYINHEAFLNSLYTNVLTNSGISQSYIVLENMFNICGQFMMDSQYEKLKEQNTKYISNKKSLKRKNCHIQNNDANNKLDLNIFYKILNDLKSYNKSLYENSDNQNSISSSSVICDNVKIEQTYNNNINKGCKDLNYKLFNYNSLNEFNDSPGSSLSADISGREIKLKNQYFPDKYDDHKNNKAARLILNLPNIGEIFVNLCQHKSNIVKNSKILTYDDKLNFLEIENIIDHYIKINCGQPIFKTIVRGKKTEKLIEIGKYIFPPNSQFLNSDISSIHILTEVGYKYDCIVMDPPWTSKSVKRKKMYKTLEASDLLKIPLSDLCNDGALVFVWVTNKKVHKQFVLEELFKKYNITFVAQWYWLKVTKYMEPVIHFHHSNNKKPYEILIIGRFNQYLKRDNTYNFSSIFQSCAKEKYNIDAYRHISENFNSKSNVEKTRNIERNKDIVLEDDIIKNVIVSIPCIIHSHKPPIDDIIKKYIKNKNIQKLELFARSLKPGWTSWGNEVLSLQHEQYFQKL